MIRKIVGSIVVVLQIKITAGSTMERGLKDNQVIEINIAKAVGTSTWVK